MLNVRVVVSELVEVSKGAQSLRLYRASFSPRLRQDPNALPEPHFCSHLQSRQCRFVSVYTERFAKFPLTQHGYSTSATQGTCTAVATTSASRSPELLLLLDVSFRTYFGLVL